MSDTKDISKDVLTSSELILATAHRLVDVEAQNTITSQLLLATVQRLARMKGEVKELKKEANARADRASSLCEADVHQKWDSDGSKIRFEADNGVGWGPWLDCDDEADADAIGEQLLAALESTWPIKRPAGWERAPE